MIRIPAYITRAIRTWSAWQRRQRLFRSCPELRALDARERAALRSHKPVRAIRAQRSQILHSALARGVRG